MTLADDNKALGQLACLVVGYTDNGRVHNGGMLHEQRLNLGGCDTKAFVFDHLFLTVNDEGIAIGIDMTDITRV